MDHSPLGRLSAEIRNRIYELVFDEGPNIGPDEPSLGIYTFQPAAALTQTCRLIRQESRTMFYFRKSISLAIRSSQQAQSLCQFLEVLGPEIVTNLHMLKMIIHDPHSHGYYKHLWAVKRKVIAFSPHKSAERLERPPAAPVVGTPCEIEEWAWMAEHMICETLAKMEVGVGFTGGFDVYPRLAVEPMSIECEELC